MTLQNISEMLANCLTVIDLSYCLSGHIHYQLDLLWLYWISNNHKMFFCFWNDEITEIYRNKLNSLVREKLLQIKKFNNNKSGQKFIGLHLFFVCLLLSAIWTYFNGREYTKIHERKRENTEKTTTLTLQWQL